MVRSALASPSCILFLGRRGNNDSRLSIRPQSGIEFATPGHQGKSHTSVPINDKGIKCRKSRRVLGRDELSFCHDYFATRWWTQIKSLRCGSGIPKDHLIIAQ